MTSEYIADLAYRALIAEVIATPKPGLVDRNNNGAHSDMCFNHFIKSADAIKPYFVKMCHKSPNNLRQIGIEAEQAMFSATDGVNTHKGAIFSLGLLCASSSLLQSRNVNDVCGNVAEIVKAIMQTDTTVNTNGSKVFSLYGIKGAKGEAESGFASVRLYGLPIYERFIETEGENTAAVKTLLSLMANVDDTNVISRGGLEGLTFVKKRANELLQDFSYENVIEFDNQLIKRNISPGGCADLLAVTIFLYNLKHG